MIIPFVLSAYPDLVKPHLCLVPAGRQTFTFSWELAKGEVRNCVVASSHVFICSQLWLAPKKKRFVDNDKGAVASIVVFFYYICRKKRQI